MQKLYAQFEPVVIDDALIRKGIVAPPPPPSSSASSKSQQQVLIPFSKIVHLRLSFAGVAKIDNLVGLSSLTTLQLDNNGISKIENLSHLTGLEVLDLSFNKISRIEGLEHLTNLRELILASNEISEIGAGLDTLVRLELLSLGRNRIADTTEITRLRKLPRLTSLSLAGNPVASPSVSSNDYPRFVLAHLGRLRYLDFRLIESTTQKTAHDAYAEQLRTLEAADAENAAAREKDRVQGERLALLKEANLLQVETLFEDLCRADVDLQALSVLPSLHDVKDEYMAAVNVLAGDFKRSALELHQSRIAECALYRATCKAAIKAVDTACADDIADFDKQLRATAASAARGEEDAVAQKLKERNAALVERLLEAEVALCEQIEVYTKLFDKKMSDIDASIVAAIQTFFGRVRDAETQFHERMGAAVLTDYESQRSNPTSDPGPAIKQLLAEKDALVNMVGASRDTQASQIDVLLEDMRKHELHTRDAIVADARAEETQRDRARCSEVWQLQQNNDKLIDKLLQLQHRSKR